jgi:hypothetical protein
METDDSAKFIQSFHLKMCDLESGILSENVEFMIL